MVNDVVVSAGVRSLGIWLLEMSDRWVSAGVRSLGT